ncbi:MAG: RNA-binding transcriptional accessory protein [Clostridiales Family XIII bacterium]|nr:RNA-binding transcriptional accessory protein [Clostridiales Family XIII bacterium]
MLNIPSALAAELKLAEAQVAATIALIDEGNTIPFIARYRKEATGGMDDVTLRELDGRLAYLRNLEARKAEILRLIEGQGGLTPDLRAEIEAAGAMQRVEDLYKPYRKKRATRASKARDAGLEPLAELVLGQSLAEGDPLEIAAAHQNPDAGYGTPELALQGALDIIAERVADDADHAALLRDFTRRRGSIASAAADAGEKTVYEMYYDFSEPILKIPNHRILAINRGEKEGRLKVRVRADADIAVGMLERRVVKGQSIFAGPLKTALADSYRRLIAPSLEREMRNELTERAETDAIKVFAKNTESLLLAPPVRGARVIAIDPGYRTGCKVAVLDERGKLLDCTTIYPTPPRSDISGSMRVLAGYADRHGANVIAIGNGTGSRETEEVVAGFIEKYGKDVRYTIVNEAGASVYSASKLASEECPGLDVTTRGAMSLGRRLQDPLAELVKIPPRSIGVGQYQHDLNQAALESALAGVVENVVNRVGVDLNTASASLLGYVAGIGAAVAKGIVAYREENGAFTDRRQLRKVPRLGDRAFGQCAGFLRISGGRNPLDATGVHPESYAIAAEILRRAGVGPEALAEGGVADMAERAGSLSRLAAELGAGLPTVRDIVAELQKPGRDIREDAPPVVFSRSVRSFEDLFVGMQLAGTIRNVVDFGAFVDIGVKQDGLVHVSRMAERFVRHPGEVVAVGDTVTAWVSSIDRERGKIGLTMVEGG